ncbi:ABC transporter permease [Aquibacillus sediminis]|uniref:ABC transporter permease n=1 Tax=Aquibacillus sediminis TaxID=2574734 RepID=UPI001109D691|nr:ABC transporter permease [Aquibacillus sediminis]
MNKFWIILSHTYVSKVKTKSFIITTAIAIALIIGLANIQSIMELFSDEESKTEIAVLDETNQMYDSLRENLAQTDEGLSLIEYQGTMEEAKLDVGEDTYHAFLYITAMDQGIPEASYYSKNVGMDPLRASIQQHLQQMKVTIAANQVGIEQGTVEEILSPVQFDVVSLSDNGAVDPTTKTEEELNEARGLVYVMLFLLYFAVLTYGNMIAMDVANEKSSRVMEILISSASPVQQMFAKIIGVALVGLTQIGLFILVGFIMLNQKRNELTGGVFDYFGLQDVTASTFVYALVFFLLGYLLYATLAAMVGSLVSRVEDVNQLMLPIIFLIIIAFMVAMFGLNAPESTFVKVTSYIPFFTPMLMFLRVGMLDIPFWETGLSIVIMVITIYILALIGARIYRGGVLMYGRSTSLKDFKQAIQLSKKE